MMVVDTLVVDDELEDELEDEEEEEEEETDGLGGGMMSVAVDDVVSSPHNDMFSSLFNKETSHELELFLNTFNIFAQKKSQLNALLKSISSLKSPAMTAMLGDDETTDPPIAVTTSGDVVDETVEEFSSDSTVPVGDQNDDNLPPPPSSSSSQQPPQMNNSESVTIAKESLAELSNQVWTALLSQMDDEIGRGGSSGGTGQVGEDDETDDVIGEEDAALSALLQRYNFFFKT